MGISAKLLGDGEHVVVSTRTHWKALVLPVLVLVVLCALTGFLLGVLPDGSYQVLTWVILIVAAAVIGWFCLRPFLLWLTSSYTITNRRLINRSGVFTRRGRDIPLHRINDVSYERGPLDRLLGCGTLVISDASEHGRSVLRDVPHAERLQLVLTDLVFGADDGRDDDGSPPEPRPG